MNKKIPTLLIPLAILSSCNTTPKELAFKVISPLGAPSIAMANYANDTNYETSATPTTVRAQLVNPNTEYKGVIFDSVTGLNLITTKDAPYRLARIITAGNLYVVSTGKDSDNTMTNDDTILSFGEGNIPDRVFKLVYPTITPDYYAPGVAQAAQALCNGLYEGSDVDYVVLSEPYVTSTMNNTTCSSNMTQVANVTNQFNTYAHNKGYTTIDGFPQAGLFIAHNYEAETYTKEVNAFLDSLDSTLKDLATKSGEKTIGALNKLDSEAVATKFGMTPAVLQDLLEDSNRLAYHSGAYDLETFYKLINVDYPTDALSRYWLEN